ncbi:hypothetical protein IWW34DRAFT_796305 [Fusarium oxysporum f. sp. albedinis]|nr:hypothetical protein IWW34DRAFT_796305 [Fusarium oxysporum f. sp. albedinis]
MKGHLGSGHPEQEAIYCSNIGALISCDTQTCNVDESDCNNRLTLEEEGRLARRPKQAFGMELYLDGDDVQEGAKLAQYSGSPIRGDYLRRLRKGSGDHIVNGHYVVQWKHGDLFLDAENESIMAKYANHSCQPNCELQEWEDSKGRTLFLVASKLIKRGDPITFEYNPKEAPTSVRVRFNEQVYDKGICYCASALCRWTPSKAIQGVLDWIEKQCQSPGRLETKPQTIGITFPRNPTCVLAPNWESSVNDTFVHVRKQLEDNLSIGMQQKREESNHCNWIIVVT